MIAKFVLGWLGACCVWLVLGCCGWMFAGFRFVCVVYTSFLGLPGVGCCGICSARFLGAGLCVLWCLVAAWLVLWFRVFGVFWFLILGGAWLWLLFVGFFSFGF